MAKKLAVVLALTIAPLALLAVPAAAMAATVSEAAVDKAQSVVGSATQNADFLSPAVWAWGITGAAGVGTMLVFGATVSRRSKKKADPAVAVHDEASQPVGQAVYA